MSQHQTQSPENLRWRSRLSWKNFLKWQFTSTRAHPSPTPTPEKTCFAQTPIGPDLFRVQFINHATVLIEFLDESGAFTRILTDPVWSNRIGPMGGLVGKPRYRPPGTSMINLPKVDVVLVSHNHYDHMDIPSLKALAKHSAPTFLVPAGDEALVGSAIHREAVVRPMQWWQTEKVNSLEITFTPALHWSGRGLRDQFKSLWGGYLIRHANRQIYFAGDTAYAGHFDIIRKRFGSPDLALLPIGSYSPSWMFGGSHLSPSQAIDAHNALGASYSMGIHFGTFQLTDESLDQPVRELEKPDLLQQSGGRFFTLKNGEYWTFPSSHPKASAPQKDDDRSSPERSGPTF